LNTAEQNFLQGEPHIVFNESSFGAFRDKPKSAITICVSSSLLLRRMFSGYKGDEEMMTMMM
jgi:hypothetical protein